MTADRIPNREEAWGLLREYVSSEPLLKHALAVEAVMRRLASIRGGDPDTWGIVGLIHDIDYERFPEEHCKRSAEILRARGWPDDIVRAVVSHGWGICSDVEPLSEMENALYAVDELTGLIIASALVRPSRSVMDLTAKSIMKKWNDKRFAAGADRSIIGKGAARLGMDLTDLITQALIGMRDAADLLGLGLKGSLHEEHREQEARP